VSEGHLPNGEKHPQLPDDRKRRACWPPVLAFEHAGYAFSGRIILAAALATKRRGAMRSASIMKRFIAPEIT
jgi:hypothetical protein